MSKYLLTNAYIKVNGVDLSIWSHNVDTPSTKEQVDVSGFNPNASKEFLPGSKDDTITVQLRQDFATGGPHATIYPLYSAGSTFIIEVRPTNSSASATNPAFGGSANVYEYNGLSGELNAAGDFTATFKPSNGASWTWGTASPT